MYRALLQAVGRVLKAPTEAPDPPAGAHASVAIFRASPRYLTYRMLVLYFVSALLFVSLAGGLVATVIAGEVAPFVVVAVLAVLAAVGIAIAWFVIRVDYDLRYYVVTDRSVRVREGAWTVREMTITHANVQNVRLQQGPLQRMFGIQDVLVDTAGGGGSGGRHGGDGSGHRVTIAGIENAREVRDQILAHVRRAGTGSGLGDLDDEDRVAVARAGGVHASEPFARALARVRDAARELRSSAERRALSR